MEPVGIVAVPEHDIVKVAEAPPLLVEKIVEEPSKTLKAEPVQVPVTTAIDVVEVKPLSTSAQPAPFVKAIATPPLDDHVDTDADVDAVAGADAAALTPQESPPPEPIQSWNPRSVMYEDTLYYWDPYRGTYSLKQVEVIYDPPVLKGPFTSPPSWFSRMLKPKAKQVPVEEPEPLEADDVRQIIHDDVTYEWDEVSRAYYPLNMKLDIK